MGTDEPGASFKFVGGVLCLDFINTVSGRLAGPDAGERDYADVIEVERLVEFSDLTRWGQAAGLLTARDRTRLEAAASAKPAEARRVVQRARALREALYRLFKAARESWAPQPADVAIMNRELTRTRAQERLVPQSGSPGWGWGWAVQGHELDRVLWLVVRSAAELLTSERLARVNHCDGTDCRWMFLDTSRNGRRRWCDMAECGNREKVRQFRQRREDPRPAPPRRGPLRSRGA